MALDVYRIQTPAQAEAILPLVEEFHRRVPGMRYGPVWSRSQITEAALRHHDTWILAAYDDGRGYLGYLWSQTNPAGELFVYQMLSRTLEAGRALTEALDTISLEVGVKDWNGLITLRPGEGAMLLQSLPRLFRLCTRFAAAPESVWVTRRTGRR